MTQTTIATKVHQTLDAQGDFTAQITFNDKFTNCFTQRVNLFFRQLTDLNIFSDTRVSQMALERVLPIPKIAVNAITVCF
jgi:hypothetical protein